MGDGATAMGADGAARCVLAVRQMLREVVSAELMLNPAIDMLLSLYLSRDTTVPWQDVCSTTATSEDTCRRWGQALKERGLVHMDDEGCRLSEEGTRVMNTVNARIWQIAQSHLSSGMAHASSEIDRLRDLRSSTHP